MSGTDTALGVSEVDLIAAAEAAFAAWDDEVLDTLFAANPTSCDTAVSEVTAAGLGPGIVGQAQVVDGEFVSPTAFKLKQFRITLNSDLAWAIGAAANKYDVQSVLAHEAGHPVGLDDLNPPKDFFLTMFARASTESIIRRDLGCGDERGVKAIYPNVNNDDPNKC